MEKHMLWNEYNRARTQFYQAQANFDNADSIEYIDIAIAELQVAEKRMDALLREFKSIAV